MTARTRNMEPRSLERILGTHSLSRDVVPPPSPTMLMELIRVVSPVAETFASASVYLSHAIGTPVGTRVKLDRKTYEFPRLAGETLYEIPLITSPDESVSLVLSNDPATLNPGQIAVLAQTAPAITVFAKNGIDYLRATLHPTYDGLTKLPNRDSFSKDFQYALRTGEEGIILGTSPGIGLVLLDVDHFKKYNDELGHQAGDKALEHVGHYLRENVRESDVCGRYGGEEFVIGAIDASKEQTIHAAERIRSAIELRSLEDVARGTLPRAITATLGVAHTSEIDPGIALPAVESKLVSLADARLYQAKHGKEGLSRNKVSSKYRPLKE